MSTKVACTIVRVCLAIKMTTVQHVRFTVSKKTVPPCKSMLHFRTASGLSPGPGPRVLDHRYVRTQARGILAWYVGHRHTLAVRT